MKLAERSRIAVWRVPVGVQLSALYTLLLVAILALLGWALYVQLDRFLVQNRATGLQEAAGAVLRDPGFGRDSRGRHPSSPGAASSGSSPVERAAGSLVRELSAPDVTVAVLDVDGNVIASTQAFNEEDARPLPALPGGWLQTALDTPARSAVSHWVVPAGTGGRQLVVVQPVSAMPAGGGPPERLLLMQAASLAAADAILNQLRLYVVLGVLAGSALGVLAGLVLTRGVLKPLDSMARTAEAIAGGDLDRRLRMPAGRNEVARLGGAFDHMVDRLAATLQAQRRFIADASHELRTPLTSLQGLSEILLMGADRGDTQAVRRVVRSMHGELGRMGRLVNDLLTLTRLDSAPRMELAAVDVGKLLDDVAEGLAGVAEAGRVRIVVDIEEPVALRADPDRLKQVILNLLDNALRYTPPGGEVRVSARLEPAAGIARLQVRDTGPGIPPEDLPHIFDRFYRGDPSRARSSGNTGLGLAIARSIVQAHGGMIQAQSIPGSGACFTVSLPAEQAGPQHLPAESPGRERHAVMPRA